MRLPTLPYISNVLRKFGIDYVYACTNGGDEQALYGEADADILQTNATSIYGEFDKRSTPEINDVAGRADVVVASRNDDGGVTQSEDHPDVLTAADLQKLGDGGAVIVQGGTAPFLAYIPSAFEDKETPQTHGPRTPRGDVMTDGPDQDIQPLEPFPLEALIGIRPPWHWANLDPDERDFLEATSTCSSPTTTTHLALEPDHLIPACWRNHPYMNQVLPVLFFAWTNSHRTAAARTGDAMYFHVRDFREHLNDYLGPPAPSCRKGVHRDPDPRWTNHGSRSTPGRVTLR